MMNRRKNMNGPRLDLRRLPVWERPSKVFDLFDRLPPGESLTFITDHEPRGMAFRMEQARKQKLILDSSRVGEREWIVHLTRATAESEAPSAAGIIRLTSVFADLDDEAYTLLASAATLHTYRRGQTIVAASDEWPYLGVAFEGVLAVASGSGNARPRIFQEVFPYEIFGELELFDEVAATARVSALSKVARVMRIPRTMILTVANRDPRILLAIGRVAAQRSRDFMQVLATHATMPIIARIAKVLLPFAMPERGLSLAQAPLPNMTQAQIAAAAGTVKEVAARAIADLEGRGMLKRERGHIRYLDRQQLADLVNEAE
jgi:CRP-like cAMP-binding protein